jgi:hypothetical protein
VERSIDSNEPNDGTLIDIAVGAGTGEAANPHGACGRSSSRSSPTASNAARLRRSAHSCSSSSIACSSGHSGAVCTRFILLLSVVWVVEGAMELQADCHMWGEVLEEDEVAGDRTRFSVGANDSKHAIEGGRMQVAESHS